MDIYQILEAIKGVEESVMKRVADMFDDWINSEDCPYSDMAGDDRAVMGCAYRYLDGKVDPSEMEDYAMALTHAYHGGIDEAFNGYWKGTDAGTPGKKMVGASESIEPTKVNPDGSWQQEGPWVKSTGKDPRGQVTHASDEAQRTTSSLEDRLRSQWEKTKREKGLQEYGMTTGGTQNPGAQDQADPAAVAKQKTDMQKSLQGIPGIDVNKAVTDLTNPKDASGINVAIANALSNPATAQKAKDLLATGMKTGQPGGV
jgi:hypothetical protein